MKEYFNLIATSTFGLESIVGDEARELGFKDVKVDNGRVDFKGTIEDICRANLWMRCADRILLNMGEFEAKSFDELFEKTKAIDWATIIPIDGKFPVTKAASVNSTLFSKSDCQSIVKKAVVESLKDKYGVEWFEETGADYDIKVSILKDKVTLTIDTSGEALHKRGYRAQGNQAPLKETMAAALVKLARWKGGDRILLDPTCGTGTILIEAAMIAKNIAPGGNRYFACEKWPLIPEKVWSDIRDEAYSLEKEDVECNIYGSDIDEDVIDIALNNIELAGMDEVITLKTLSLVDIESLGEKGAIIMNPPYGERIGEEKEVQQLYRTMGNVFKNKFKDWSYYVLTSNTDFEKLFGKKATKNRKLYNGNILCYLYQYYAGKI